MVKDIRIHETGDGGDFCWGGKDIRTGDALIDQAYIRLFGSDNDWWGNVLFDLGGKFYTALETEALNSAGIKKLEEFAKADLQGLDVDVELSLQGPGRLLIKINNFQLVWTGEKCEVKTDKLIQIQSPADGDEVTPNTTETITYTAVSTPSIFSVKIEYYYNNQWTEIDTVANTGTYDWAVPYDVYGASKIKISDASDASVFDERNINFADAGVEITTTKVGTYEMTFDGLNNGTVYWGDGTSEITTNNTVSHEYTQSGEKRIRVFCEIDYRAKALLAPSMEITNIVSYEDTFERKSKADLGNNDLTDLDLTNMLFACANGPTYFMLLNNYNLQAINFDPRQTEMGGFNANNCAFTELDFKNIVFTQVAAPIRLEGISELTAINNLKGVQRALIAYGLSLTGVLDLSEFSINAYTYLYENYNLENIILGSTEFYRGNFLLYDCNLGVINWDDAGEIGNGANIQIYNNTMSAAEVDENLTRLDSCGAENCTLDISGNNAAPTDGSVTGFDGIAAAINLRDNKNWTVSVTGGL